MGDFYPHNLFYIHNLVYQKMASFTVHIPDDLKKKMNELPEINWPEYIKQRFEVRLAQLEKFEQLVNEGRI